MRIGTGFGSDMLMAFATGVDETAALLAESTWQLWGEDAVDAGGGALGSWPAAAGPSCILDASFGTPAIVTRADLNNKKFVRFVKSEGDLIVVNGDVNATSGGDHTLLVFHAPALPSYYDGSNLLRGYITVANNAASTRLALGVHTANDQRVTNAHRYRGFYNGNANGDTTPNTGWHNFTRTDGGFVFSQGGPQCMITALGDTSYHMIDGVTEGTSAYYVTKLAFHKGSGGRHTIGGETTETSSTGDTFYGGDIGCILYWPRKLTEAEAQTITTYINTYYGWTVPAYDLPIQISAGSLTAWWSSRRDYTCGNAEPTASTWMDMIAQIPLTATGTPAPSSGVANFDGTDDEYTTTSAWSALVDADGWTIGGVIRASAINTSASGATIYANDIVLRDQSGFGGIVVRDNGGSTYQIVNFQWDTAAKSAAAAISLNTDHYFVARYRGGATDILEIKVDGGAWVQTTSVGDIGTLTGTISCGGLSGGTTLQFAGIMPALCTWDSSISDGDVTLLEAYLAEQAA